MDRWIDLALLGILAVAPVPATAKSAIASASATASPAAAQGPDVWIVYGTPDVPKRDDGVVGASSIVAPPRAAPADPWTSGASVLIPQALAAGRHFTFAFWAKAGAAETIPLLFQAREAPYTAFLTTSVALTPHWQLFVRSAVVPAPMLAGTQAVGLQLGRTRSAITLGPVAMFDGRASRARVVAAFKAFHPDRVAEAVSFSSDPGVKLAGTLRTPVGHGPGPYPLAIFIQGHGPNGRGYCSPLMDRLLADGIATMAYDKRGINQSTGTYSEDVDALTRDAHAAVASMRRRPDIDGWRIALVGHSQGGQIAPAVASADPRIAAIVSFAGPVGDGVDLFRRSMHDQLIKSGHVEATVKPLVDAAVALLQARLGHAAPDVIEPLQAAVIDGLVANGFTRAQAEEALASVDKDEIYAIGRTHIASDLASLHIPVLAVFGSLDPIVTAPGNAAAARVALAHNPKGKVVVLDGLSHWFQEGAKTGSEEESKRLGQSIGSPRAVALASEWLRAVLAPGPADQASRTSSSRSDGQDDGCRSQEQFCRAANGWSGSGSAALRFRTERSSTQDDMRTGLQPLLPALSYGNGRRKCGHCGEARDEFRIFSTAPSSLSHCIKRIVLRPEPENSSRSPRLCGTSLACLKSLWSQNLEAKYERVCAFSGAENSDCIPYASGTRRRTSQLGMPTEA